MTSRSRDPGGIRADKVNIQPGSASSWQTSGDGPAYTNTNSRFLANGDWALAAAPGAAVCLTVFAFNRLGDGLRDALDPRLRR